jgi:hypothetical protein
MKIKMTIEQAVEQLDSLSRERKHKIQVNDGIAISLVLRELNRLRERLRQRDVMLAAAEEITGQSWTIEAVRYGTGQIAHYALFHDGNWVDTHFASALEAYAAIKESEKQIAVE